MGEKEKQRTPRKTAAVVVQLLPPRPQTQATTVMSNVDVAVLDKSWKYKSLLNLATRGTPPKKKHRTPKKMKTNKSKKKNSAKKKKSTKKKPVGIVLPRKVPQLHPLNLILPILPILLRMKKCKIPPTMKM